MFDRKRNIESGNSRVAVRFEAHIFHLAKNRLPAAGVHGPIPLPLDPYDAFVERLWLQRIKPFENWHRAIVFLEEDHISLRHRALVSLKKKLRKIAKFVNEDRCSLGSAAARDERRPAQ
jgi:hypothetical protein